MAWRRSHFALRTLTEETRRAKADLEKLPGRMDLGSTIVPLGTTNGTTNAVMFGVLLMAYRDPFGRVYESAAAKDGASRHGRCPALVAFPAEEDDLH